MEHCSCSNCENEVEVKKEKIDIELILNIIGVLIFIFNIVFKIDETLTLILYFVSYILIGYEIIIDAVKLLFKKNIFNENMLMIIATFGAFTIGEQTEGIAVLIFYKLGEFIQNKAVNKSKKRIENVLNIKPEYANLKVDNNIKIVSPKELKKEDVIIIKVGEKVPVDGIVVKGTSTLDMTLLTGESIPKEITVNDEILSGSINLSGILEIKVTKRFDDSTIYKIIELIENASKNKSQTEQFISKFAKIYTPIVVMIALVIAIVPVLVFNQNIYEYLRRALIFLVVSCPCALVLSIPLRIFCWNRSKSVRKEF